MKGYFRRDSVKSYFSLYAKEIHPSIAPVFSLMLVYETIVASIIVYVGLAWQEVTVVS